MSKSYRVEKIDFKLLRPFGPAILSGRLSDNVFNDFKGIIDKVLKEKKRDHSKQLAGRIDEEWTIEPSDYYQTQTEEFLLNLCEHYGRMIVSRYIDNGNQGDETDPNKIDMTPTITGGWVNEMKSGEYNPTHFHPHCNVTSVFFFNDVDGKFIKEIIAPESPEQSGRKVTKNNSGDGYLELIYKSGGYFEQGTFRVKPQKGDFLMFPSSLLHTVYPFISDKTRISASFNFILHSSFGMVNFGDR